MNRRGLLQAIAGLGAVAAAAPLLAACRDRDPAPPDPAAVLDSFSYGAASPLRPHLGDIYVSTVSMRIYRWSGTNWTDAGPSGPAAGLPDHRQP